PDTQRSEAIFWARAHLSIYAAVIAVTIAMLVSGAGWKSAIPILLIGGPRVYGCWHFVMTGLLQHGGLPEDVIDHRLNSRTLYMNPISRWLYWNMNYHVEHHMFPMVPYYSLPALHEEIKDDLPGPNTSIWDAYREMMQAIMIQRKDPEYAFRRPLPASAKPYKEHLHKIVPERSEE
ncbi:MAG: fatty acid desaturase, partial [Rhizobiaceae bacterium]